MQLSNMEFKSIRVLLKKESIDVKRRENCCVKLMKYVVVIIQYRKGT